MRRHVSGLASPVATSLSTQGDQFATKRRFESINQLRGLAAIAVAWFHFTQGEVLTEGWLKASGAQGFLGVQMFFVISGFVIPYSMVNGGFQWRVDFGRFLSKRLFRLEPPYLASVVLVILLMYLSAIMPGYRGASPELSWSQVLLHVAYLNAFFDQPWLNPVYWTLAVEFQYYLFACFTFPVLFSPNPWWRRLALGCCLLASLLPSQEAFLPQWLGLFTLGSIGCMWATQRIAGREALVWSILACSMTAVVHGTSVALVGMFTLLSIWWLRDIPKTPLTFLGMISYSIYLLHVPIGGRVVNLASRLEPGLLRDVIAVTAALVLTILAAWIWYRLVEKPSMAWASRVQYQGNMTRDR